MHLAWDGIVEGYRYIHLIVTAKETTIVVEDVLSALVMFPSSM